MSALPSVEWVQRRVEEALRARAEPVEVSNTILTRDGALKICEELRIHCRLSAPRGAYSFSPFAFGEKKNHEVLA